MGLSRHGLRMLKAARPDFMSDEHLAWPDFGRPLSPSPEQQTGKQEKHAKQDTKSRIPNFPAFLSALWAPVGQLSVVPPHQKSKEIATLAGAEEAPGTGRGHARMRPALRETSTPILCAPA